MSAAAADVLFVTGFWSPATLGRPSSRVLGTYLRLFEELHAKLPFPLHAWVEPGSVEAVSRIVREPGAGARLVRALPFEALPFHARLDACRHLPHLANRVAAKHSVEFAAASWSKPWLMQRAAEEHVRAGALSSDPAARVAWIDFGIARVADMDVRWGEFAGALQRTDRVRLCQMRPVGLDEVRCARTFYERDRGHVAAGFLSAALAGDAAIDTFARACECAVDEMIEVGRVALEEQVFAKVLAENPAWFDCYTAYYWGVLRNVPGIERDLDVALAALRRARQLEMHEAGTRIYREIVGAADAGRIKLWTFHAAPLLFDGLICAWYVDRPLALDAARVASLLYAAGEPTFRAAVQPMRPRFDENLAFAGESFDRPSSDEAAAEICRHPRFRAWSGAL